MFCFQRGWTDLDVNGRSKPFYPSLVLHASRFSMVGVDERAGEGSITAMPRGGTAWISVFVIVVLNFDRCSAGFQAPTVQKFVQNLLILCCHVSPRTSRRRHGCYRINSVLKCQHHPVAPKIL